MAIDSNQRPTIRQGGTHVFRISLDRDLDEGDTISAATVSEISTSDLTISSVTIGAAAATILERSIAVSRWIQVTVSGHLSATGTYRLKTVFSTDGGVVDKACKEDFVFDVVAS